MDFQTGRELHWRHPFANSPGSLAGVTFGAKEMKEVSAKRFELQLDIQNVSQCGDGGQTTFGRGALVVNHWVY